MSVPGYRIKRAEDGNGTILRLYAAEGTGTRCTLDFGRNVARVESTNMLEEPQACLVTDDSTVELEFAAFEVKTLRITN